MNASAQPVVLLADGTVLAPDPWRLLGDGDPLPETGYWLVRLERLGELPPAVSAGVLLPNTADVEALGLPLERLAMIALEFPAFGDGRAYSQARILRGRLGWRGALRATGAVTQDQLWEMGRCGFDQFALREGEDLDACRRALRRYSVVYQPAADGRKPALHQRRGRAATGGPIR